MIAETEGDLINRLNEWNDNMENRGMRVNMNKTKVMIKKKWGTAEGNTEGCKMAMWCLWWRHW